jgi:hypothetical protein
MRPVIFPMLPEGLRLPSLAGLDVLAGAQKFPFNNWSR